MGKKARKLRSPKYARKATALRNTVNRLNSNNNSAPTKNLKAESEETPSCTMGRGTATKLKEPPKCIIQ